MLHRLKAFTFSNFRDSNPLKLKKGKVLGVAKQW